MLYYARVRTIHYLLVEIILTEEKEEQPFSGSLEDILNEEQLRALQQGGPFSEEQVRQLLEGQPERTQLRIFLGLEIFNKLPASLVPPSLEDRVKTSDGERAARRLRVYKGARAAMQELNGRKDLPSLIALLQWLQATGA